MWKPHPKKSQCKALLVAVSEVAVPVDVWEVAVFVWVVVCVSEVDLNWLVLGGEETLPEPILGLCGV